MSRAKSSSSIIFAIILTALVSALQAAVLVNQNFDDPDIANSYAPLGNGPWLPGWDAWLQAGNCNTGSTMSVSSNAAFRGTAGLDIYYHMNNDPAAQGDCQLHQDNNTSLIHAFLPGLNHYFIRGYLRFPFSTATLCSQPVVQRKLIYFKAQNYPTGSSFIMNAWPWADCPTDGYNVSIAYGGPNGMDNTLWGNGSPGFFPTNNHLRVNTWYYIEAEVEYRTYGNDILRIWLAPAGALPNLIFERTDLALRSSADAAGGITLGTVEIGRQADIARDSFSQGIDEHRHWDEISIDITRIGPIDGSGGDTMPPAAPTNLTVQ
jgi:hypothetical protein